MRLQGTAHEHYQKRFNEALPFYKAFAHLTVYGGGSGAGLRGLVTRRGVNLAERFKGLATRESEALRQQYVDAVTGLAERIPGMQRAGFSSEQIARALHAERRALGVKYKDLTPAAERAAIYERNLKLYGDRLGPSVDWLRKAGKSWDDIIESATRTGGKDLVFK